MPVVERIPGQAPIEHRDDEWLHINSFAQRGLGITGSTFEGAVTFGGARRLALPNVWGQRFFLAGDFPKTIDWLQDSVGAWGKHFHPWACVRTSQDFEVRTPSGATIRFTYEPKNEQKDPADLYSLREHEVVFQRKSLPEGYSEFNPLEDERNERQILRDPDIRRASTDLLKRHKLTRGRNCRITALRDPHTRFPQRGVVLVVTNMDPIFKDAKRIWPPARSRF